jgi:hypothetical protein
MIAQTVSYLIKEESSSPPEISKCVRACLPLLSFLHGGRFGPYADTEKRHRLGSRDELWLQTKHLDLALPPE